MVRHLVSTQDIGVRFSVPALREVRYVSQLGNMATTLRLRRKRGGSCTVYETLDGQWEIVKDPHPEWTGWAGRTCTAWLIYEKDDDEPFWIKGGRAWRTLREARALLAEHLEEAKKVCG